MDALVPGSLLNAASLNTPVAQIATDCNAVVPGMIVERSLGAEQLPAQIIDSQFLAYDHANPVYAGPAYPGYNTMAPGWSVIDSNGSAGGGTDLEITFAAPVDLTGEVVGIFLEACFEVLCAYETIAVNGATVFFALEAYNGAVWTRIVETESWSRHVGVYTDRLAYGSHPIKFLLTRSNQNGILLVSKVRARVSCSGGVGAVNPLEVRLGTVSLGGLVLRGGTL